MNDEIVKDFAILAELDTSSKLVRLGFGELQNLNQENDFYFLPFQLLSQGFERFMKAYICLAYWNENGRYPSLAYIKNLGHDLEKLLSEIRRKYFIVNHRPVLQDDDLFFETNNDLRELLFILSEFGKLARYHNFDIITGNPTPSINPEELWNVFRNNIILSDPNKIEKMKNLDHPNEISGLLSRHVLVIFEKFVAALSRQFVTGILGQKGQQFSSFFSDFLHFYREKDFGNRNYRSNTTRFKEYNRKAHKRNLIDKVKTKFKREYKSRKVIKSNYEGEWPFYADHVTIESREKNWYIVIINGYDYALNGSAKGKYKIEGPDDAGMTILGKDFSNFIKMAKEL